METMTLQAASAGAGSRRRKGRSGLLSAAATTQAEKFTAAKAAVKAFIAKHGNILFLGEGTKAEKLKQKFYSLQDAASDAYWTDEMDAAVRGGL